MATHRSTSSTPPDLSEGGGSDLPLDHALSLLLADETENALRWGAAVLESGPWTPSALVITARLLDQMGRRRAAIEGLKLAVQRAIAAGNLPLAMAAIGDLRTLGAEVDGSIEDLASSFCQGSDRLRDTQAAPLLPQLGEFQPLSPFLTGPALASKAAQILESVRNTDEPGTGAPPPRVEPLPLFSALGKAALRDLLGAFETVTVPAGHAVIHEGEEGAAAYIVARGELEVSRRSADADGKPLVLARLGSGAFFGEMAILSQLPGAASVIATRPSILLVAKREALEAVVEKHPEVATELAAHCRRQSVANLGWASPVVVAIPPQARAALVERFETRVFDAGDRLVETGEDARGLHLVVSGEVAVVAYEGGERVVLATLTPGETVGEVELVLCRNASADAIAVRPTATLFLPREEFFSVVEDHPAILHGLYALAVRRHGETKLALEAGSSAMTDEALLGDSSSRDVAALVEPAPPARDTQEMAASAGIAPLARGTMNLPRVTTPPRGMPRVTTPPRGTAMPSPPANHTATRRSFPPPPLPPPAAVAAPRVTVPPPVPRSERAPAVAPHIPIPLVPSGSVAPTAAAVAAKAAAPREGSQAFGRLALVAMAAAAIAVVAVRGLHTGEPAAPAAPAATPATLALPAATVLPAAHAEPAATTAESEAKAAPPAPKPKPAAPVAAQAPRPKPAVTPAQPAAAAPVTAQAPVTATASTPAPPLQVAPRPAAAEQVSAAGEFGGRE